MHRHQFASSWTLASACKHVNTLKYGFPLISAAASCFRFFKYSFLVQTEIEPPAAMKGCFCTSSRGRIPAQQTFWSRIVAAASGFFVSRHGLKNDSTKFFRCDLDVGSIYFLDVLVLECAISLFLMGPLVCLCLLHLIDFSLFQCFVLHWPEEACRGHFLLLFTFFSALLMCRTVTFPLCGWWVWVVRAVFVVLFWPRLSLKVIYASF